MIFLVLTIIIPLLVTPFRIGNPYFIIAGFLFVFFITKFYVISNVGGDFLLGLKPNEICIEMKYMIFYLFMAYLTSTIYIYYKKKYPVKIRFTQYNVRSHTYYAAIFLPLLLVLLAIKNGISPLSQPVQMRQFSESNGMFYLLAPVFFLIYLTMIGFLSIIGKKKVPPVKVIIATIVSLAYAIISGFGSTIVICFGIYGIYLSAYKRIKMEKFLFLALPVVMFYALIQNQYRMSKIDTTSNVNVVDLVTDLDVDQVLVVSLFNRFDYLEMFVKGHQYIVENQADLGISLLSSVIQIVPRSLWPDKPYNTSSYFSRKVIPDVVNDVGSTANFNSLNEFSRSFGGFLGVLLGGTVFGLIIGAIYVQYSTAYGNEYLSLKYSTVLYLFCFVGFIAGFVNDQAPQLLLINYLLFKFFVRGKIQQVV